MSNCLLTTDTKQNNFRIMLYLFIYLFIHLFICSFIFLLLFAISLISIHVYLINLYVPGDCNSFRCYVLSKKSAVSFSRYLEFCVFL